MSTAEVAPESPADHPRKDSQKSRVANGSALLPGVDGRSAWVRRAKEIIADHISDLGGMDNTSAAERSLVRRASTLSVELERLEAKFATAGEASIADLEAYGRASNTLRRLLEAVGLQRRPRDTTVIDAEAERMSHAERERRRRFLDKRTVELAAEIAAGVTVVYPDR
jgi:hypothetical protein